MKKKLYIWCFLVLFSFSAFAQESEEGVGRMREKMVEYIQQKLSLSKSEAERFSPVFLEYFRELRKTNQELRGGDKLVLQQKIVELRLRYRDQFRNIIGEKKGNDVFHYEREFVKEVKELREDRLQGKGDGRANKRF
jgi:hypothetical protein